MTQPPLLTDDLGNGSWPPCSPEERRKRRREAYHHAMENYVIPALLLPVGLVVIAAVAAVLFGPYTSVGTILFLLGLRLLDD